MGPSENWEFWQCIKSTLFQIEYSVGIPLEEEEEEEDDISWTGKLRSLIHKIKGLPKMEKKKTTEEEEKYPSKSFIYIGAFYFTFKEKKWKFACSNLAVTVNSTSSIGQPTISNSPI